MLRSDGPRERILCMGGWGAGKSTCAVDLARWASETSSDFRVQVIDTTYEADRNFHGVDGPEIRTVESWDDYMGAVRAFRDTGSSGDWLVVDRMDQVWDAAQSGYSEKAFGKEIDDWFLEYRKDHAAGHPFSGDYGTHWGTIKRMYGAFVTELMRYKGHVLVTAKAETVQEPNREGKGGDGSEIRAEFGKFGVKPAGEKNVGFLFHTVLLLREVRPGEWVYTTIRDRNREQQKGKAMGRFVTSYLVPVAGWKL